MRESLDVVPGKVRSSGPEANWTASAGDSDQRGCMCVTMARGSEWQLVIDILQCIPPLLHDRTNETTRLPVITGAVRREKKCPSPEAFVFSFSWKK